MRPNRRPQKTALILAQRIVRDIDKGGLEPGDKLPAERLMMDQYDAGRGTLRESLRFLELQGVLSFKPGPGGGPLVEKPGPESLAATLALLLQFDGAEYRVIAEARSAFEPLMARLAAERITDEGLEMLAQSVVDMEQRLDDVDAYLAANETFHNVVAWSSGNSLFGFLVDAMVGSMDMSGNAQGIEYPIRRRQAVLAAHRSILESIEQGKADDAERSMRVHIDEYFTYAERKFPEAMGRRITWQ